MNVLRKAKGFTIIEVVLVLAIAGLIFLVVLLAVPALQRSQRDTQRRNDVSRFMSQLQQYQSNNRGKVPTNTAGADGVDQFVSKYLVVGTDTWADPSTGVLYDHDATVADKGQWEYYPGQQCDGENVVSAGGDARKVAIRMKLEGAGTYCLNN
jgi:prepilin-type N-terminal cleavage/methylation domain-containing protein